jgi:uncharacterized NAD(P)/FAD-binding protein YdhS
MGERTARPAAPECERLVSVADESHKLGEFLDWLEQRYTLCTHDDPEGRYWPAFFSKEKLLAEYFKIDLDKVERERRALLNHLRSTNGGSGG